jgi:cell division protein FtsW (lipid II flippase)
MVKTMKKWQHNLACSTILATLIAIFVFFLEGSNPITTFLLIMLVVVALILINFCLCPVNREANKAKFTTAVLDTTKKCPSCGALNLSKESRCIRCQEPFPT